MMILGEVVNQFDLLCHILIPCFFWIADHVTVEDIYGTRNHT
jgi:hypothetical protein